MARPLTVGSDFSGLDTVSWALKLLGVPYVNRFACDSDRSSHKVCSFAGTQNLFLDVSTRSPMETPEVDLYSCGPPCQPFSRRGQQGGVADARGVLALHSLTYILVREPQMVLMEQVPEVLRIAPDLMQLVMEQLTQAGYALHSQILETQHYGVPQTRKRLYLVAFKRQVNAFSFPAAVGCPPASSFITPLPQDQFELLPSSVCKTKRKNVETHLQRRISEGVNPFERPVFVASGSSADFSNSMVDMCMTMTRSEASRGGYWCSIKGGFLDTVELARLQGFPDNLIPWRQLEISAHQAGGLLGNAMSLNLLIHLLPGMLFAAGYISEEEFQRQMRFAREYHPAKHGQ